MPRGKDAPTRVGGQLDPYVQSSVQQSKQLAQNRLVTSMQEAGAAQRSRLASETQLESQRIQQETQLQGQAAASAADDRRAAEAERGRREDQKFAEAMQKVTQTHQAKQAELNREHQAAMVSGDRTYAEKIQDKKDALRRFEIEKQTAAQQRSTNAILSMVKGSGQRELAKQKALTVLDQEATQFDKDKDIYERTKSRVAINVESDKRMDFPIGGKFEMKGKQITPTMGFGAGYAQIRTLVPGTKADPMGVLQDQLDKNKANVSIEQLAPERIHELEEGIENGTVDAEDVRSTLGVLEGMAEVLKQKKVDNPASTDESKHDFWNNAYRSVLDMRDGIEGLTLSQKKISGSDKETVGARIQYALGVIRNNSLGGRAARLRELSGGNFESVLDEMTKSIQVPALWDVGPEMSDYEQEIREEENAMYMRLYPDIGGTE